jgi:hypothetical protein
MFHLITNSIARAALSTADLLVEFSTLGEYRVGVVEETHVVARPQDLWSADVEWTVPPSHARGECRLPRIHDRGTKLAPAA